ncbi:MAG: hypothetical protein EBZ47_08515 [Chlamydiae bacterium]|nr:hypothetical protein [Chlamydiota bacterium]
MDRPDSKNTPIQSIYERYVQLQACKYVDEILVYETEHDLLQLLMTQTIHIRFLSDEYLHRDFTGKQWCIENNIELHYHKRQHIYSSSELRKRIYEREKKRLDGIILTELPQHLLNLSNP